MRSKTNNDIKINTENELIGRLFDFINDLTFQRDEVKEKRGQLLVHHVNCCKDYSQRRSLMPLLEESIQS
ncbi:hypothetical protein VULLAG_LOCUS2583 [Vulpes lagopus]